MWIIIRIGPCVLSVCFLCDTNFIIQRFSPTDLFTALCKLVEIGISYCWILLCNYVSIWNETSYIQREKFSFLEFDLFVWCRYVVSGYLDIQAILAIHYPDTEKVEILKYPSIHEIQVSMYPRIREHKKLRYPTIQVSKHWIVG